jgi:acyl-CoA hydrolase/GNAT superfamily N-acetyltransferase
MQLLSSDLWQELVTPGARVFVGSNAACPHALMREFLKNASQFHDLELVHILTLGDTPWCAEKHVEQFKVNSLFLGPGSRDAVAKGYADYTPCFMSEIPGLFLERVLPLDVALIQITPPDQHGYCSLGLSVDVVSAAVRSATHVIAQINSLMPRTHGRSFVHVSQIDAYIEEDMQLPELATSALDEVTKRIGQYVSTLIGDGNTLQMGIGKIPDAVLANLKGHRDLGIHTEMFSDSLIDLLETSVVNNRKKTINAGKTITSFCIGTRKVYDYVDNNPHVEFHPSEYVNNPSVIAKHENMVSVNSAIEVDLSGQVVADSIGHRLYSGIGGQVDFIRGAMLSHGGKSIIALPATASGGTISRIVPYPTEGAGIVTSRGDVYFVVTEYGVATLRGRSIQERAFELTQVAHPQFREELIEKARKHSRVPAYKKHRATQVPELGDIELIPTRFKGEEYLLRPLRPSDDRRIQEFFYSHSEETLRHRYRHRPVDMPRKQSYELVNVDQSHDLGLCVVQRQGPREMLHAIGRYYLNKKGHAAEVAFVVRESKRRLGMASTLLKYLIEVARKRNVARLEANVEAINVSMVMVLENAGFTRKPSSDLNEYDMVLDLQK